VRRSARVRTSSKKQAHDFQVPSLAGDIQWGSTLATRRLYFDAVVQQHSDGFNVPFQAGNPQRRPIAPRRQVCARPVLNHDSDDVSASIFGRYIEWCLIIGINCLHICPVVQKKLHDAGVTRCASSRQRSAPTIILLRDISTALNQSNANFQISLPSCGD